VQAADVVVTMGCGDVCPVFPGKRYLDQPVPHPAGRTVDEVRPIRSTGASATCCGTLVTEPPAPRQVGR
jgi:hypothetical protein